MMKLMITSILFSVLLLFTGCSTTEYVYLESKIPKIELMTKVPTVSGQRDDFNCVCDSQLDDLLNTTAELRFSEEYYEQEVTRQHNFKQPIDK